MSGDLIKVDFAGLVDHGLVVGRLARDVDVAREAADSVRLGGGAFGLMCTPLLVPALSVVSSVAKAALGQAGDAVHRAGRSVQRLADNFETIERNNLTLIRELESDLGAIR